MLTNNHVVGEHMREVTVVLSDRRERAAKLIGVDQMTDLAVLKIDGANLPLIPMGRLVAAARSREWVLAIGKPVSAQSDGDPRHHQRPRPRRH